MERRVVDASAGEALWNPVAALQIEQLEWTECAANDVRGWNDLREAYCLSRWRTSLREVQARGFDLLVTSGAKEALWLSLAIGTGERLLIPRWGWPGYQVVAERLGRRVSHYDPLDPSEAMGDSRSRARGRDLLVLNCPHNPTGFVPSEEQLEGLRVSTNSAGASVLVDVVLEGFAKRSMLSLETLGKWPHGIFADSLSKWLGVPGWRLGFVMAEREWIGKAAAFRDSLMSGVTTPVQACATKVLTHPRLDPLLEERKRGLTDRMERVRGGLLQLGHEIAGDFSLYAWAKAHVDGVGSGEIPLSSSLAARVAEGDGFGRPGWFRLCPHNADELGTWCANHVSDARHTGERRWIEEARS